MHAIIYATPRIFSCDEQVFFGWVVTSGDEVSLSALPLDHRRPPGTARRSADVGSRVATARTEVHGGKGRAGRTAFGCLMPRPQAELSGGRRQRTESQPGRGLQLPRPAPH